MKYITTILLASITLAILLVAAFSIVIYILTAQAMGEIERMHTQIYLEGGE